MVVHGGPESSLSRKIDCLDERLLVREYASLLEDSDDWAQGGSSHRLVNFQCKARLVNVPLY